MTGTLYLVATPIGNLGDMSVRALETLRSVDLIAAEDTRVSIKLLNHFDIRKPMVSYFEHNRMESGAKLVEKLLSGENIALITDAGMPAISDPGEDMVRLCSEHGIQVIPIPGPCAVVTALAVSALPTQRFCFEGFLSTSRKNRFQHLEELKSEKRTIIFYEAPHKLIKTLEDMLGVWGDRNISISRELTKLHEETLHTTISGALKHFTEVFPKGEFVLVIEGAEEVKIKMSKEEALEILHRLRNEGKTLKEAAKLAGTESGFSKNELYNLAVKEK